MTKQFWLLVAAPCALALSLGACASDDDDDDDDDDDNTPTASAVAQIKSTDGTTLGTATFTQGSKGVTLVAEVSGAATKGVQVGLHIHQKPQCDGSTSPPFTSAGDHWNPGKVDGDYGPKGASPNSGYLGELGQIALDADGKGRLEFTSSNWKIGTGKYEEDVVGRAIILHIVDDTPDDGKGAPRQGCGEVAKKLGSGAPGGAPSLAGGGRRV